MNNNYEQSDRIDDIYNVKIKVIGIGSGGINAVVGMIPKLEGIEFWKIDTDIINSIERISVSNSLTLRDRSEWESKIVTALNGADLVFLLAGMGGKNGLDAMMEVARVSKQVIGALTVGVVTRPFSFEGAERCTRAAIGIEHLVSQVDTLVTISNDKLLEGNNSVSNQAAFVLADKIMQSAVQCISDSMMIHGVICADFADVRSVLSDAGLAYFGVGRGEGKLRVKDVALQAISSPLLECSIEGARGIILSITGDNDLTIAEVSNAAVTVYEVLDPTINIIFGSSIDRDYEGIVNVSIIVTDFANRV